MSRYNRIKFKEGRRVKQISVSRNGLANNISAINSIL